MVVDFNHDGTTRCLGQPEKVVVPLRPITIKQVLRAKTSRTLENKEAVYLDDGIQVSQVRLGFMLVVSNV